MKLTFDQLVAKYKKEKKRDPEGLARRVLGVSSDLDLSRTPLVIEADSLAQMVDRHERKQWELAQQRKKAAAERKRRSRKESFRFQGSFLDGRIRLAETRMSRLRARQGG